MKGAKWADLRRIGKQKDNIGPCLARAIPCHTMPYHAIPCHGGRRRCFCLLLLNRHRSLGCGCQGKGFHTEELPLSLAQPAVRWRVENWLEDVKDGFQNSKRADHIQLNSFRQAVLRCAEEFHVSVQLITSVWFNRVSISWKVCSHKKNPSKPFPFLDTVFLQDVLWWSYSVHQWQLRAKQISRRIVSEEVQRAQLCICAVKSDQVLQNFGGKSRRSAQNS